MAGGCDATRIGEELPDVELLAGMASSAVRCDDLTVVIQAGGASKRMGRSKALVEFLGEPLLLRGVRRFLPIAGELLVTTNEADKLGFIADTVGAGVVRLVSDLYGERGALKGLLTALTAATLPYVAVIAVDMAFASPRLTLAELDALKRAGSDLAIPHAEYGYEPFHAVYRRESCIPQVQAGIARGEERASGWYTLETRMLVLDLDFIAACEPGVNCFANCNTPTELASLQKLARQSEVRDR